VGASAAAGEVEALEMEAEASRSGMLRAVLRAGRSYARQAGRANGAANACVRACAVVSGGAARRATEGSRSANAMMGRKPELKPEPGVMEMGGVRLALVSALVRPAESVARPQPEEALRCCLCMQAVLCSTAVRPDGAWRVRVRGPAATWRGAGLCWGSARCFPVLLVAVECGVEGGVAGGTARTGAGLVPE
jgi:hypothetical protein